METIPRMLGDELVLASKVASGGNLKSYFEKLHQNMDENFNPELFLNNAFEGYLAAVLHLHQNGILHRDLAARNVLVEHGNPPNVKITDFGRSVFLKSGERIIQRPSEENPLRWTDPHALLTHQFSPFTDVFGCKIMAMETIAFVAGITHFAPFVIPDLENVTDPDIKDRLEQLHFNNTKFINGYKEGSLNAVTYINLVYQQLEIQLAIKRKEILLSNPPNKDKRLDCIAAAEASLRNYKKFLTLPNEANLTNELCIDTYTGTQLKHDFQAGKIHAEQSKQLPKKGLYKTERINKNLLFGSPQPLTSAPQPGNSTSAPKPASNPSSKNPPE